jgi:glutathione peroxidase
MVGNAPVVDRIGPDMSTDTLTLLDGSDTTLDAYAGQALLVVNVASQCGFTRQYAGLEALYERYHERGLTVIGVPSNQFGAQEPGTAEEIAEFCQANFGVTFPLLAKTDVNGPDRHPLFARLTEVADATGKAGDVTWNFEKFLVSPQGEVVGRFRSKVEPDDPELVAAIESVLPR